MSGVGAFVRNVWAREPVVCFACAIGAVGKYGLNACSSRSIATNMSLWTQVANARDLKLLQDFCCL